MNLLIDVNVAVDICTQRAPHALPSAIALETARTNNVRLWLYVGSTQTLEYTLYQHLQQENKDAGRPFSNKSVLAKSRRLLTEFAKDKHWLAALAGEGPVFDSNDPEDEQLIRALDRFAPDSIRLLTRDRQLLSAHPKRTISPHAYCEPAS